MSIMDKIEKIRRKPEHIRLRYVWFFVAVSMLFVLVIWAFSIKNNSANQAPASENDLFNPDMLNSLGEQKKALDSTRQQIQNSFPAQEQTAPATDGTQNNNNLNNANQ